MAAAALAAAAACGEINAPVRAAGYEWRLLVDQPGDAVDTLAFTWEPDRLPVRLYVQDTLDYPARVRRAVAQWESQFLFGEFQAALVSDSSAADVIVRAEEAPPEGPIISLRLDRRARECEGATDIAVDLDTRQVRLPMRVYVTPVLEGDPQLPRCLDITLAHELGHAMGIFNHSPDAADLMAADPNADGPTAADRATVERAYRAPRTLNVVGR
jgi:predicted Zn-dependent protease